ERQPPRQVRPRQRTPLIVRVDQHDLPALAHRARGQVERRRRLPRTALTVHHRNDQDHSPRSQQRPGPAPLTNFPGSSGENTTAHTTPNPTSQAQPVQPQPIPPPHVPPPHVPPRCGMVWGGAPQRGQAQLVPTHTVPARIASSLPGSGWTATTPSADPLTSTQPLPYRTVANRPWPP